MNWRIINLNPIRTVMVGLEAFRTGSGFRQSGSVTNQPNPFHNSKSSPHPNPIPNAKKKKKKKERTQREEANSAIFPIKPLSSSLSTHHLSHRCLFLPSFSVKKWRYAFQCAELPASSRCSSSASQYGHSRPYQLSWPLRSHR